MTKSTIRIHLPETVYSIYVVPVRKEPADIEQTIGDAIGRHLQAPMKDLALELVSSPMMQVHSGPVHEFPPVPLDVVEAMGAGPEVLAILAESERLIAIRTLNAAVWPPYHEFAGRAVAAALARELGSVVVDVQVPQAMSVDDAMATLPDGAIGVNFSEWLLCLQSAGESGYWFTTRGLFRLGLPDLQSRAVPPQLRERWALIMRGAAWSVVTRFMDAVSVKEPAVSFDLPAEIVISRADLGYVGDDAAGRATIALHLQLDEPTKDDQGMEPEQFLNVVPPPGYDRSAGEYFAEMCYGMFGSQESAIVRVAPSDAMAAAMETARNSLDEVRTRFVSGALPPKTQFIVKFAVRKDDAAEYLWAFVNDWSDPQALQGSCANDAELSEDIRVGRPLTIMSDAVCDWALVVDGDVVEGGWTMQLLQEQ